MCYPQCLLTIDVSVRQAFPLFRMPGFARQNAKVADCFAGGRRADSSAGGPWGRFVFKLRMMLREYLQTAHVSVNMYDYGDW